MDDLNCAEIMKIYYRKRTPNEYVHESEFRVETLSKTHVELPAEAVAKLNIGAKPTIFTVTDEDILRTIAERVFRVMNHNEENPLSCYHVDGGHQEWVKGKTHTSMSVGDIVCIADEYIMCADVGWEIMV
tara:strand:+ start:3502 stop:3891 length:390 start_codon:yes stop_codon:yes gene_type:complete